MRKPGRESRLYGWLVVSIILHSCLLALPGGFLETMFPARRGPVQTVTTDLTPDFEGMAIQVVMMPAEAVPASIEPAEIVETATVPYPVDPGPTEPGSGPGTPAGGGGDSTSEADTRFFPPIPRIIVPPALEDLDIPRLSVEIRILVGTDGIPVRIELPEYLTDQEVRRRLMQSANRFRFEPARKGNSPVSSWISLPLQLEKSSAR